MAEVGSYCRFCGAKIIDPASSKFCANCGKPISLPAPPPPPSPRPTAPPPAAPSPPSSPPPPAVPTAPSSVGGISRSKARKKTSKKKIAGIVVLVIIGFFAVLIAIGASLNSTPSTFTRAGSPSDQEIETQIAQASPNPEMDTLWNKGLNMCMDWHLKGNNLYEVDCDGRAITEERDSDCQVFYNGELLLCNPNTSLGKKFQSYLNTIGYPTG